MADPANLDPNVLPYIPRTDGDLIRADEWNDIQRSARQDIQKHRHTGEGTNPDDGVPIDADGLQDGSVTTDKLEAAAVTSDKISDQAVSEAKLADEAVTQAKIKDGSDSIRCNFPVLTNIKIIEDFGKLSSDGLDSSPSIASDTAGNIHVAWTGRDTGNKISIWYAKMDKDGNILIPPAPKLDSASGSNNRPTMVGDFDGNLQILWDGRDAGASNRGAIFYAKLGGNGNVVNAPQIKIRAATGSAASGGPNGNFFSKAAIDPGGNIQLVWEGIGTDNVRSIFYAKLDKNGGFIIPPTLKLNVGRSNRLPTGAVDAEGNFHVFWVKDNILPFHAQLDLNGNITISPSVLSFILDTHSNRVMDAISAGDGNIVLAAGRTFTNLRAIFPKMDKTANLFSPLFPTYAFVPEALARDNEGKFHMVFALSGEIAYVKLDIEKPPAQNVSLTELMTTFKAFNFTAGFAPLTED